MKLKKCKKEEIMQGNKRAFSAKLSGLGFGLPAENCKLSLLMKLSNSEVITLPVIKSCSFMKQSRIFLVNGLLCLSESLFVFLTHPTPNIQIL